MDSKRSTRKPPTPANNGSGVEALFRAGGVVDGARAGDDAEATRAGASPVS